MVLELKGCNINKVEIRLGPIVQKYGSRKQVWEINKEKTGFWSIRTEFKDKLLALSSVDYLDASKGMYLAEYDPNNIQQQWTIQE